MSDDKTILVTGASGFLGWHVANHLNDEYAVGMAYSSNPVEMSGCNAFSLDITDPQSIKSCFEQCDPAVIVHCAALASGKTCQDDPPYARAVNIKGTENLLSAFNRPDGFFIYISTDLVFDGEHAPYRETDESHPVSVYGNSKREAEQYVLNTCSNSLVLRPPLMYGPITGMGKGSFAQWIDTQFQTAGKVNLFCDEVRTPAYVYDIAEAVKRLIADPGPERIYHVGGPERITRSAFGYKLAEIRGYDARKIHETYLADMSTGYPRPRDVSLDSTRIQQTHGLRLTSVEEGIRDTFSQ
ncbi:sugar nucleotide-binding protein [bacterium]|nr:sugar nucleotide-binding protein [bacterium]